MTTLKALIDTIRSNWPSVEVRFAHPTLYVIVESTHFEGMSRDERVKVFAESLKISPVDVDTHFSSGVITLTLVTPAERSRELEFLPSDTSAHHWVEFLAGASEIERAPFKPGSQSIHFYGFKGGQGRSSVLSLLARALAEDSYRVLVVDADIEAPSLQAQFNASVDDLASTILGIATFGLYPQFQRAYTPRSASGFVDLIACKPTAQDYGLDLAVLALTSALDPARLGPVFQKIAEAGKDYDLILIDHRSGISSSVLPVISTLPGPCVICMRLDEQSNEAEQYIRVLLNRNPENPGLFVSFSLDPEDTAEKMRSRAGGTIERMLGLLADAISLGTDQANIEDSSLATPDVLQSYWVSWFHDRAFLRSVSPTPSDLSVDNQKSLSDIRRLIGILPRSKRVVALPTDMSQSALTNSGSTDEGQLIQTDALRKLRSPHSNFRYVFGRKGTGKTRLVRALADEKLGDLMLSALDEMSGQSVNSANELFIDVSRQLYEHKAAGLLWWVILDCVLQGPRIAWSDRMLFWKDEIRKSGPSVIDITQIVANIAALEKPRILLIDGVETAFEPLQMPSFIEGLFRFLATLQANPQTAGRLTVRLFLRTDLFQYGGENVEQQVEGRVLYLSWDTQSIFNFALSRLAALPWFQDKFESAVEEIRGRQADIAEGALLVDECDAVLSQIFPQKVRRNNLLTLTFLKTYFSEGEGESASYYPRIYDAFLRGIDDPESIGPEAARLNRIESGRVGQNLIIAAHDYASSAYMKQVTAELKHMVRLANDETGTVIEEFMKGFRGMPTPFIVAECMDAIQEKLSGGSVAIPLEDVRNAFTQMKRIGIFEDRPGVSGSWRAGRLFKNALGMKYVR